MDRRVRSIEDDAMSRDEAIQLIEEAVNADRGSVRGTETLEEISWDSLASVSLIGLVDDRSGRVLEPSKLAKCRTVAELLAVLESP
jgi:acyl carrier protein